MHLLLASLLLALLAHLTSATGISLSSFTPRIDNLPSACRAVYTTSIDGCAATDFASGAACSVQCLAGLVRIGVSVKSGCGDVDVGETSIIGVFQNGLGVAALCPNNQLSTTTAGSQTSVASQTARSTTAASTTLQTSTSTSAQVTTTASPPPSSAQASSTSSSGGIAIDTTATQAASTTFHFNDPTAAPTSTGTSSGNSQLSNSDSGGGSPFDVVAIGAAGITQATMASVFAALLFAACL